MTPTEFYGSLLALGLVGVVVALLAWQWVERSRRRVAELSEDDRLHFAAQDLRRGFVAAIMVVLALAVFFGVRLPERVDTRPNLIFVATWIAIFILVNLLTVFAMADWFATRRYAARHRRAIVREGVELIRVEKEIRDARALKDATAGEQNGAATQ